MESLCRVCGEPSAKMHYGSLCCSGCKGFFRRTVRFRKTYECPRAHNCEMSKKYRNACRACRMQKCLAVGLNPQLVQGDWGRQHAPVAAAVAESPPSLGSPEDDANREEETTHGANTQIATNSSDASAQQGHLIHHNQVLNTQMVTQGALVCTSSQRQQAIGVIPSSMVSSVGSQQHCFRSITDYFVALERLCNLFCESPIAGQSSNSTGAEQGRLNLEVPVQMAYRQPGMVCNRVPMAWSSTKLTHPNVFAQLYARLLVHYFDWASNLPERAQFAEQDWLHLITRRSLRCTWLLVSYRASQMDIDGIPLSCDHFFPLSREELAKLDAGLREMFTDTIQMAMDALVQPFREMHITEAEYAILRVLSFYTPVPRLSSEARLLLAQLREKYLAVLSELTQAQTGAAECAPESIQRMNRLLMTLTRAEQIAQLDDNAFSMLTAFNIAQMRGTLTYEMHLGSR